MRGCLDSAVFQSTIHSLPRGAARVYCPMPSLSSDCDFCTTIFSHHTMPLENYETIRISFPVPSGPTLALCARGTRHLDSYLAHKNQPPMLAPQEVCDRSNNVRCGITKAPWR